MKQSLSVLAFAAIMVFSPSQSFAQRSTQPQEIYKILGISVEGNTFAEPAAIIANTGLKIGDEVVFPGDQAAQADGHGRHAQGAFLA